MFIRAAGSAFPLSILRNYTSLAIQKVLKEDSDQNAQADLNFRRTLMYEGEVSDLAANMVAKFVCLFVCLFFFSVYSPYLLHMPYVLTFYHNLAGQCENVSSGIRAV